MSVTRSLKLSFASITLVVGTLWAHGTPGAPVATQDAAPAAAPADAPPYKPVARVSSLMTGIGMAFGRLREVQQETENEHRLGQMAALSEVIAELSNVHMRFRRKPDYIEMAAGTRSIALELAGEARSETPDEAQLMNMVVRLDNSCATCHDAQQ